MLSAVGFRKSCQDISVAGKQKGLIDDQGNTTRSGLWFEYLRLIDEIRPRYVIIENVANLRGNGLVRVLQDLWKIGFDAEWHIISARAVGACHRRDRIWILAYPSSERRGQGSSENMELQIEKECGQLRKQSGRRSWEDGSCSTFSGINGEDGTVTEHIESTHTDSIGCLERERLPQEIQSRGYEGLQRSEDEQSCLSESIHSPNEVQSTTNSNSEGLEGCNVGGGCLEADGKKTLSKSGNTSISKQIKSPNTDNLRLWKSFASEEEKRQWWAEATFSFRGWWQVEPSICRVDDVLSAGLHTPERVRKQRIKQLGNSVVPAIPEFIGDRILFYEAIKWL